MTGLLFCVFERLLSILGLAIPEQGLFPVGEASSGLATKLAQRTSGEMGLVAVNVSRYPIHPLTERADEYEAH